VKVLYKKEDPEVYIDDVLDSEILRKPKKSSVKCAQEYVDIFHKYKNIQLSKKMYNRLIVACERMKLEKLIIE
jgi:hypothetical protein